MPQTQQPQVDGSQKNPQQQVYQQQQRQNHQQQYQRAPTKVRFSHILVDIGLISLMFSLLRAEFNLSWYASTCEQSTDTE